MASRPPQPRLPRRRALLAGALAATGLYFFKTQRAEANGPEKLTKTPAEWRKTLTPGQYRILRDSGTEPPFSSPLNKEARVGRFLCAACGNTLFESGAKYDSGTGWPSFFRALPSGVATVQTAVDRMLLQKEVRCARCDGHLGHVFRDGPRPTGLRYCMNGLALRFEKGR